MKREITREAVKHATGYLNELILCSKTGSKPEFAELKKKFSVPSNINEAIKRLGYMTTTGTGSSTNYHTTIEVAHPWHGRAVLLEVKEINKETVRKKKEKDGVPTEEHHITQEFEQGVMVSKSDIKNLVCSYLSSESKSAELSQSLLKLTASFL